MIYEVTVRIIMYINNGGSENISVLHSYWNEATFLTTLHLFIFFYSKSVTILFVSAVY